MDKWLHKNIMTKILSHKYENNHISFEVELNGEKKWVKGSDFTGDHSIIQHYFEECDKKAKEKVSTNWNLSQETIPPPTNILEIVNIDDVSHALCIFDSFDSPVYVPTRFLTNSYPSILIKFFEDQILQNPEKYS